MPPKLRVSATVRLPVRPRAADTSAAHRTCTGAGVAREDSQCIQALGTGSLTRIKLCREILEAHGGRLSLANRAGGGALVTVWLP